MFSGEGLFLSSIIFTVSLVVLIGGAEIAVKRVLCVLRHFDLSDTFGGLVIFSLSTSVPEIITHITASAGIVAGTLDYKIASSTVLGANIGSDVIQQTMILGIVVLAMGKMIFKKSFLLSAYLPMIGTTLMTLILSWDRTLSRVDGIILLGSFFIYMFFLYKQEMSEAFGDQEEEEVNLLKDIVISLVCLAAVVFSARFLLEATETIIKSTGLESSLFGVITIGVASAAPELFTALSGFRNEAIGISMGTLIGSNITNPLFAIGGGAIISGYWVPKQLIYWDLPMETVTAAILLVYLLSKKKECELSRWGGVYLIALYGVYLTLRILIFETL